MVCILKENLMFALSASLRSVFKSKWSEQAFWVEGVEVAELSGAVCMLKEN